MKVETNFNIGDKVYYAKEVLDEGVTCKNCNGDYEITIQGKKYFCDDCKLGKTDRSVYKVFEGIIKGIKTTTGHCNHNPKGGTIIDYCLGGIMIYQGQAYRTKQEAELIATEENIKYAK